MIGSPYMNLNLVNILFFLLLQESVIGFSVILMTTSSTTGRDLYGVPNSGWKSSQWKWGYGRGTGHDCAKICRKNYRMPSSRQILIDTLLQGDTDDTATDNLSFEEAKLVLALTWQRARRKDRDGGPDGYRQVLATMAEAERYEDVGAGDTRLVQDMIERFLTLTPTESEIIRMETVRAAASVLQEEENTALSDGVKKRCAGLVLQAIGFVTHGC